MNGLPYYKAYPRDFLEGTIGMPFELKATYRLLLDLIYMQGGDLPDDARYISGLLGMSVRRWKDLREKLISAGKIAAKDGIISNFRADKELEKSRTFQHKQRENRSKPNKINNLQSPTFNHTEAEAEAIENSLQQPLSSSAPARAAAVSKGLFYELAEMAGGDPSKEFQWKSYDIAGWLSAGVPIETIKGVLSDTGGRRAAKGEKPPRSGFRYFDAAVREAHARGEEFAASVMHSPEPGEPAKRMTARVQQIIQAVMANEAPCMQPPPTPEEVAEATERVEAFKAKRDGKAA